jgi:hypothetical protein
MTPPKCPKCSSTEATRQKLGGRVPPGHPAVSVAVGAFRLAHWAGLWPSEYTCNRCGNEFLYWCGRSKQSGG